MKTSKLITSTAFAGLLLFGLSSCDKQEDEFYSTPKSEEINQNEEEETSNQTIENKTDTIPWEEIDPKIPAGDSAIIIKPTDGFIPWEEINPNIPTSDSVVLIKPNLDSIPCPFYVMVVDENGQTVCKCMDSI